MEVGDVSMSSVDERVVQMRFDNSQFESGVSTTMKTLEKLKEKLQFKKADAGLEDLAKSFDSFGNSTMSGVAANVQKLADRFSTLGIIGMTAVQNITNAVMNMGNQLLSAVSTNAIRDGFAEYETQMNAVQTILSNTRAEGTNVETVNKALDELNTYADKTIYNFTEMTRNIGTFTAAGVKLDTSVNAIQGIANLAAVSGSTSQQASTAMYQLSQALATGTVKLMDWNSVVNAGMGGEVFQNALKETSRELNTGADAAIAANGSFRESLSTGWLTSEVLTETLKKFTTSGAFEWVGKYCDVSADAVEQAYNQAYANSKAEKSSEKQAEAIDSVAESLANQTGKSKDAIKEALEFAYDAEDAATKVKTFTQLIDTLGEALGSGWTKSWQIIIGDFEEAKELWTEVSDILSGYINDSAAARNAMLQSWSDLGGRTSLINTFANAWKGLVTIVTKVKSAFTEVFPPMTAEKLYNITKAVEDLSSKFKDKSEVIGDYAHDIALGIFSAASIVIKVIQSLGKIAGSFLKTLKPVIAVLGDGIKVISEWAKKANDAVTPTNKFTQVAESLANVLKSLFEWLSKIAGEVGNKAISIFSSISTAINNGLNSLKNINISDIFTSILDKIRNVIDWVKENVTLGDIFAGILTGGAASILVGVYNKIKPLLEMIQNLFGSGSKEKVSGLKDKISDLFDNLSDSLEKFTSSVSTGKLVAIAGAIGILTLSVSKLSTLSVPQLVTSTGAIIAMFAILTKAVEYTEKITKEYSSKKLIATAFAMMELAEAVNIMATAVQKIGGMDLGDIVKGLAGVGGALAILVLAMKQLDKLDSGGKNIANAGSILILSVAMLAVGKALKNVAALSWEDIGKGLVGIGFTLAELVGATVILNKFTTGGRNLANAASILLLAIALQGIGRALRKVAELSWDEMWRGLTGLSLVFAELVGATVILNKFTTGGRNLANAASILLLAIALQGIGRALRKVAELSWDEINRGLVGVGVTLAELVASLTILSNFTDIGSCLASAASLLMASWSLKNIGEALQTITEYSWDQISNAVSGIGGLFFVMAGTLAVLGQLGGFNTLLASAGLLVASYSLANIADAISTLTRYSWDQIQRAVDGIFDVFAALALTIGVLGKLAGFSSILGAAGLLVASKSLVEISQSISKLAEYSWDQIDNAVSGLITVFTILAGASGIVGALTGVLGLLGGGTILLASQSLGNIADAISTLTKYSWNQIQRSVDGLLLAMESIAGASTIATFGGAGAEAIVTCSKSLGDVARALGVMAGYSWEEIYKGVLGFKSALGVISNALNNSILSGPGADAFATIAQPMGDLAVSMGKWKGVVISQNLTERLPELGKGIASFWDAGFSADSLRSVAEPLGNLASSVNAWKNVTIPEDMQKNLKQLADGVSAFIFSESGANAISTIAFPLGNLANSLKNWKDVDVPDDLAGELREVASGVNAFTLTGTGSDNLAKCSDPLRNMGTALKTWQGITLGTYLGDMLESLAVGIMKFTGISEAITNIGSATTPLADLAVSMKAWSGTYVPANMTNMLTYLSDGIKSFTGTQSAISVFNTVSDALLKIATSMTSINNADFEKPVTELQTMITAINNLPSITSNLGTDLTTFSDTVGSAVDTFCFMVSSAASNVSTNLDNLNASITNTLTAFASNVSSGLGGVASTIATQTDAICTSLNSVGTSMANMVTGITDNMLSAQNAVTDSCSKIINSCTTTATQFEDVGRNFMVKMASGIRTENSPKTSASSILSGVKDTFTNAYSTFYNIGGNISKGLANGISDGRSKVVSAAVKVATDAIQAAKDASGVASPSKKTYAIARWCIIGAVNGINQNGSKLVDSFTDAMTDAMNATADVANNYRDYMNPTITPVVDLSSANKTVSNLNSLLPDNRMLDFTANAKARSVTATFKGRTEIEADYQKAILDSNAKVVTAVASLGTDISSYTDAIANSETAMYVDGKKLASSIVKPMNQQLGILAKRNG